MENWCMDIDAREGGDDEVLDGCVVVEPLHLFRVEA
jgi:hypothetical protein